MRQLGLFVPQSSWTPPEELPRLHGDIAVDLETRDPFLKKLGAGWCFQDRDYGYPIGVSVSAGNFTGYFPFDHETEGNLPKEKILGWLREELGREDQEKIFANALYDLGWLRTMGVTPKGKINDVLTAAPLIWEHFGPDCYNLDWLGEHYIKDRKDEKILEEAARAAGVDPKSQMYLIDPKYVGPYAEQDALLTRRLWEHLKVEIDKDKETVHEVIGNDVKRTREIKLPSLRQVYNLETDVIPVLLDMRWNGVRIDVERAGRMEIKYRGIEKEAISIIKDITGLRVDPWAAESVAKAFDQIGDSSYGRTGKTNAPSITQEWLAAHPSELAKQVLRARKASKAYTTFIAKIIEHSPKGRLHGEFHPLRGEGGGTISGRFSSTKINLQNQPSPDKDYSEDDTDIMMGKDIRSLFLPEEGEEFGALDYSQQEPRLTIHFSFILGLKGAKAATMQFRENPRTDYHQFVADICGIARKPAKIINLGLAYGMGGAKLCKRLGMPTKMVENKYWEPGCGRPKMYEVPDEEGQAILDKYNEKLPYIKELDQQCKKLANDRGWIKTILGRMCRFEYEKSGEKRKFTHAALNRLIQGSAGDQIKKSLVELHKEKIKILLTVHDENGLSLKDRKEAKYAKEIMENCVPLSVPSVVDVDMGRSWGEATTVEL